MVSQGSQQSRTLLLPARGELEFCTSMHGLQGQHRPLCYGQPESLQLILQDCAALHYLHHFLCAMQLSSLQASAEHPFIPEYRYIHAQGSAAQYMHEHAAQRSNLQLNNSHVCLYRGQLDNAHSTFPVLSKSLLM